MKLSTGKDLYANGDIFGLTKNGELTEGYDCHLFDDEEVGEPPRLTPAEKVEIAEMMIRRWENFRIKWSQR